MTKVSKSTIREVMKDYRENNRNYGGYHVQLNLTTGEMWIDWFIDGNSWNEYKDENIIDVPVAHVMNHFGATIEALSFAVEDLNKDGFRVEVVA